MEELAFPAAPGTELRLPPPAASLLNTCSVVELCINGMLRDNEMSIGTLRPAAFTDEEKAQLLTDLLALKKTQIREFLLRHELLRSGTKEEIRGRIEEAIDSDDLSFSDVVSFLDEVIPWGKQHVYLYKGPQAPIGNWHQTEWVARLLKKHRFGKYLNASLPLALPKKMKVSSILHDSSRLRVARRTSWPVGGTRP
jgi:hypothetical protein